MRRRTWVRIYERDIILDEVKEWAKFDGVKVEKNYFSLTIELYADNPVFITLIDELDRRGLHYSYSEVREYTKKEIKEAKYYHMELMFPWELDGITADEFGTKYVKEGNDCYCSRKQISDLTINITKMKKYDMATIEPEIIINEKVRNILIDNNITGYELKPVIDCKGRKEPNYYQLLITNILPPMSSKIRIETENVNEVKKCNRCGTFLRSEIVYEEESLKEVYDFNLTQEYYGVSMYCKQFTVVSPKLYELIKQHKLKRAIFEPVTII